MQYLTLTLFITLLLIGCSTDIQQTNNTKITTEIKDDPYISISNERFNEIENLLDSCKQNLSNLKGCTKEELVKFYIQSYSDETINKWIDWAYKKMKSFEDSSPTEEQDVEFKKLLDLPRNKNNMLKFMMVMKTEQIQIVGY